MEAQSSGAAPVESKDTPVVRQAFVHLGHGFGATSWRIRHTAGMIPGLNDRLPYGYYRAEDDGWRVVHSEDASERATMRLVRRGLCRLLGFDLIHAWRNRRRLYDADVLWIHTELEGLAALSLLRFAARRKKPKTVVQCVWLFDKWRHLSAGRRALYRYLLRRADVITTLSTANLRVAREILPDKASRCVLMGISTEHITRPVMRRAHSPIHLASLGSDMHRDWRTLRDAVGGDSRYNARIASGRVPTGMFGNSDNVEVVKATTEREVLDLYEWADIVILPLLHNLHASGITVALEAAVLGVPVIATDTGGMRLYFSDREVCYVQAGDAQELGGAVARLAADDQLRREMAIRAQERVLRADLTSQGFARRHRWLSEAVLEESRQLLARIPDVVP